MHEVASLVRNSGEYCHPVHSGPWPSTTVENTRNRVGHTAAVVGGGLFGATGAIALAEAGWTVKLFERGPHILRGASAKNLLRLHSGYHYPRSPETGAESLAARNDFLSWFEEAVGPNVPHYYAIAREGSLTSPEAFVEHCNRLGLPWHLEESDLLRPNTTSICVRANEMVLDVQRLREACTARLASSGVQVFTDAVPSRSALDPFDLRVISAYGDNGSILNELGFQAKMFQLELCEVAKVRIEQTVQQSLVVMDGPFISLTPIGSDRFLLYHVDHSVHLRETTTHLAPSPRLREMCAAGPLATPPISNFESILHSAREFIDFPTDPVHLGSSFTVRPILPGVDGSDERPTIIDRLDEHTVSVLSGKLGTCVANAHEIVRLAGTPSSVPTMRNLAEGSP